MRTDTPGDTPGSPYATSPNRGGGGLAWGQLRGRSGAGGNLVTDAHLAALAIEHGALLCASDRDFGRFPGLRWADPLAGT